MERNSRRAQPRSQKPCGCKMSAERGGETGQQALAEDLTMIKNEIWNRAKDAAKKADGDVEELGLLIQEHPWLPKHWGPLALMEGRSGQERGTLLMLAAWEDRWNPTAMLAPLSDVRALDILGESPLFYAVLCGNKPMRQKMVEALAPHADLGAGSEYRAKKSAAMMAVERYQSETADIILSLMTSADMGHRCEKGANIWHYMCRSSDAELSWIDMIEQKPGMLLLLDVEDNEGETPRSLARKRGDDFGAGLLAKAEAMEMAEAIGEAVSVGSKRRL